MMSCRFESKALMANASNSNGFGARIAQLGSSKGIIPTHGENSTGVKSGAQIEIFVPIRTVSELNNSDHWRVKHKRHRGQQYAVQVLLKKYAGKIPVPCHVHLTRFSPGKLDKHDNLPGSLKYVLDTVCAIITGDFRPGRADDDERISISYDQVKCPEYGVKIEISWPA